MSLWIPFFFLLVDSAFESLLVFSGAASAVPLLPVVAGCVVTSDGDSVPAGALPALGAGSGVRAGALTGLEGVSVNALVELTLDELELFAGTAALPLPAPGPTAMISAPTFAPEADAEPDDTVDTASTGPESPAFTAAFGSPVFAGRMARLKDGPDAPGFKTSVAETSSSGGFKFGSPL